MQETQQELSLIANFGSLPKESLNMLAQNLGLRMSTAELTYCARNYNSKDGKDVTAPVLRMLDALACPECIESGKIAAREMLTDSGEIAETYRDVIQKLRAIGHPSDKPITLEDIAKLPVRYLQALGGSKEQTPTIAQAEYADALVLLCAADADEAFDASIASLLSDEQISRFLHCKADLSYAGILQNVLTLCSGAVINVARLPEALQNVELLALPAGGLMIALPQSILPTLQQKAEEMGIACCYFGVVDHAGALTLKFGAESLVSLDFNYLKSLCFIRSYALQLQTDTPFTLAMTSAAKAYCKAIAAGLAPQEIRLRANLRTSAQKPLSCSYGDALAALLGLYRFAMEFSVRIETHVAFDAEHMELTVAADMPAETAPLPREQSRVYLLYPQYDKQGLPVMEDLRKLTAYLHGHARAGKLQAVFAIGEKTPAELLEQLTEGGGCMIKNEDFSQALDRTYPAAFLVLTKERLQGDLIALFAPSVKREDADCR
ncbi:MAG: hypothetical protein IKB28_06725 [Clostridia bacterium]|nr:hypothetical protein [Clostridia bacterium]